MDNFVLITPQGKVKGRLKDSCMKYLGVPYAEAPVGNLQFKAPIEKLEWFGELDATKFANDPIQHPMYFGCSEDCLYLNVYVPKCVSLGIKLPVVVWLFGGSYVHGGCSGTVVKHGKRGLYDAETFAVENSCIVVTINYRLGLHGFLYLTGISDKFESNLGLKDCEMALRWVRRNIDSYGGDVNNVTLWGESAGAALAVAMMCVPSAKDLFHKVISQSACLESFYTPEEATEIAKKYLELAGVTNIDEINKYDYKQLTKVIKSIDAYVREKKFGICSVNPVVDGEYLKEFPSISSFADLGKPILIGSNANEARVFGKVMKGFKRDEVLKRIFPSFSEEYRQKVIDAYSQNPKTRDFCDIAGDIMYKVQKYNVADAISVNHPVYVYQFNYAPVIFRLFGWGACHVAELPLLFGNMKPWFRMPLYLGDQTTAAAVGKRMRKYWGNFIWSGNPNYANDGDHPMDVVWSKYTSTDRNCMNFGKTDSCIKDQDVETMQKLQGERHFFVRK